VLVGGSTRVRFGARPCRRHDGKTAAHRPAIPDEVVALGAAFAGRGADRGSDTRWLDGPRGPPLLAGASMTMGGNR